VKGQLSAEMLVLMVVILGVVMLAASQIIGSARETSEGIGNHTKKLNAIAEEGMKSSEGAFCFEDEDCRQGLSCMENRCV
jgi:hypothetical protein